MTLNLIMKYPSVSLPYDSAERSAQIRWCVFNLEDHEWDWDPVTDSLLFANTHIKTMFQLSWG
jgi:hypothetical protein